MNLWRKIWRFFNPPKLVEKSTTDLEDGNVHVKLSRGWVKAGLMKQNRKTSWVKLWDGNIIKRRNKMVKQLAHKNKEG